MQFFTRRESARFDRRQRIRQRDFGKLTEWRWLGGKVLCVVFAGMMLAFVPKILKKRG